VGDSVKPDLILEPGLGIHGQPVTARCPDSHPCQTEQEWGKHCQRDVNGLPMCERFSTDEERVNPDAGPVLRPDQYGHWVLSRAVWRRP
jgi:hypothetical protein